MATKSLNNVINLGYSREDICFVGHVGIWRTYDQIRNVILTNKNDLCTHKKDKKFVEIN